MLIASVRLVFSPIIFFLLLLNFKLMWKVHSEENKYKFCGFQPVILNMKN